MRTSMTVFSSESGDSHCSIHLGSFLSKSKHLQNRPLAGCRDPPLPGCEATSIPPEFYLPGVTSHAQSLTPCCTCASPAAIYSLHACVLRVCNPKDKTTLCFLFTICGPIPSSKLQSFQPPATFPCKEQDGPTESGCSQYSPSGKLFGPLTKITGEVGLLLLLAGQVAYRSGDREVGGFGGSQSRSGQNSSPQAQEGELAGCQSLVGSG